MPLPSLGFTASQRPWRRKVRNLVSQSTQSRRVMSIPKWCVPCRPTYCRRLSRVYPSGGSERPAILPEGSYFLPATTVTLSPGLLFRSTAANTCTEQAACARSEGGSAECIPHNECGISFCREIFFKSQSLQIGRAHV